MTTFQEMMNKFKYAFQGLKYLLQDHSVLLQVFFAACAIIVGFLFHFTATEMMIVGLLCALVITLEATNSVIEIIAEQFDITHDQNIGKIKDMMAGVVLIAAIASFIIGLYILVQHI